MAIINGVDIPDFEQSEFVDDPKYAKRRLLVNTQKYRDILDCPIIISPVKGSLARLDGSLDSEHRVIERYDKIIKHSTAIDVFPQCDIFKAWTIAQNCGLWKGIGVYFDTHRNGVYAPMLHLDLRNIPLIWYRVDGDYHYPHEKDFYKNLLLVMAELDYFRYS